MIDIRQRVIFDCPDKPEAGYLLWHYGTQFTICDSMMQVIDVFNVNKADGNICVARAEAREHFENVHLALFD